MSVVKFSRPRAHTSPSMSSSCLASAAGARIVSAMMARMKLPVLKNSALPCLDGLPAEVMIKILVALDPLSVVKLSQISKDFHRHLAAPVNEIKKYHSWYAHKTITYEDGSVYFFTDLLLDVLTDPHLAHYILSLDINPIMPHDNRIAPPFLDLWDPDGEYWWNQENGRWKHPSDVPERVRRTRSYENCFVKDMGGERSERISLGINSSKLLREDEREEWRDAYEWDTDDQCPASLWKLLVLKLPNLRTLKLKHWWPLVGHPDGVRPPPGSFQHLTLIDVSHQAPSLLGNITIHSVLRIIDQMPSLAEFKLNDLTEFCVLDRPGVKYQPGQIEYPSWIFERLDTKLQKRLWLTATRIDARGLRLLNGAIKSGHKEPRVEEIPRSWARAGYISSYYSKDYPRICWAHGCQAQIIPGVWVGTEKSCQPTMKLTTFQATIGPMTWLAPCHEDLLDYLKLSGHTSLEFLRLKLKNFHCDTHEVVGDDDTLYKVALCARDSCLRRFNQGYAQMYQGYRPDYQQFPHLKVLDIQASPLIEFMIRKKVPWYKTLASCIGVRAKTPKFNHMVDGTTNLKTILPSSLRILRVHEMGVHVELARALMIGLHEIATRTDVFPNLQLIGVHLYGNMPYREVCELKQAFGQLKAECDYAGIHLGGGICDDTLTVGQWKEWHNPERPVGKWKGCKSINDEIRQLVTVSGYKTWEPHWASDEYEKEQGLPPTRRYEAWDAEHKKMEEAEEERKMEAEREQMEADRLRNEAAAHPGVSERHLLSRGVQMQYFGRRPMFGHGFF